MLAIMTIVSQTSPQLFPKPGKGTVVKTITTHQEGRVKYQASYWPARLYDKSGLTQLDPDQAVTVLGRDGITLLIQASS